MHVNEKQHDPDLWREGALSARESSASARIQNPHPNLLSFSPCTALVGYLLKETCDISHVWSIR
jgi:hypothetical protein